MIRAAWKSLLARKLRLLLSTFAIVLGVAFVAGSFIFTDTLNRSFTALFASASGDVVVRPIGATDEGGNLSAKTVPGELVDELSEIEGAARVDGNVTALGVYLVDEDGKLVGQTGPPGIGLSFSGAPAADGLEGLQVTEGRPPSGPFEVVVDSATVERAGYEIGDKIKVVTSSPDYPLLQPVLVGELGFPGGGSTNGASFTAFDTASAQRFFNGGEDVYQDIWVTREEGVSQEELRDRVKEVLPPGVEAITGDEAADENADDLLEAISFISTFLLVFAAISLVVGSFLIVNTFSILVAQRSRELALMRALGASRRQVTGSVMVEAVVLGFVGSTIGLGLGVLLALAIRALFANFGLDLSGQSLVFAPRTVIAAYVVGMVVTLLAAYLPARRSGRVPPVAALRDDVAMPESSLRRRLVIGAAMVVAGIAGMLTGLYADVPRPLVWVGLGILVTLLGVAGASPVVGRPVVTLGAAVYRRVFGTVGRLAGQNALRNPRRTAATASALMIGLALVTTMAIAGASAKASIDQTISRNFVGDAIISNVFGQPFSTRVARDVERLPEVEDMLRVRFSFGRIGGDREGIAAVDPGKVEDVVAVTMVDGFLGDLRDGAVIVDQSTADEEGYAVGDTVVFKLADADQELEIVGVFEDNPALFFPMVTTLGTLTEAGLQQADNYLMITRADGVDQDRLISVLEEQVADLPTVTVKDQESFAAEQRGPIDQLLLMIYALLGLALVIAVMGIVNTLALSVIERTREVGLLRAVGLSRRQLRRMIGLESVVIAVLGAVLGVGMGIVFGLALMTSLRSEGLEVVSIPGGQLVGFIVAAMAIGVLAALLPARRAARLDVLRAISTE